MTPREHALQLINEMTDEQVAAAEQYLVSLKDDEDPVLKALMEAEFDDEPLTPEELERLEKGREDIKHGRLVSLEDAERRLLNR